MPRRFKPAKRDLYLERMFETRSEAWERVGLEVAEADERTVKRAQIKSIVLIPLMIAIVIAYDHQKQWFGGNHETVARVITVVLLMLCGWALARDVGKAFGPSFMRRMDPATAGTVGFLLRLVTIAITLLIGLHVVGVSTKALTVGGAFTAVILGLAAQQTLGNVFAGMVLLTARPFRVGERIRLQAGVVGGTAEGTVSSLGLLYTTLTHGYDRMMIPNNVVLAAAIVPLKEPDSVDVKVRLSSGVRPTQVQAILDNEVSTPTRSKATVLLEEVDGDEVVVRVQATPELAHDGAALADEIIAALASVTGEHQTVGSDEVAARDDGTRSDDLSTAPTMHARTPPGPHSDSDGDGDGDGNGMRRGADGPTIRRGPGRVRE